MELDSKNRKLVALLEDNSRATLSDLAKEVKLSREAINYRIKRLQDNGVIKSFIAMIDFAKLGYTSFALYFKLQNVTDREEKEIIESLKLNKNIIWLASVGGSYDLVIELIAKDIQDFNIQYSNFLSQFHKFIARSEVIIRLEQNQLPRSYIHEIKQSNEKKKTSTITLDEADKRILLLLSQNARIPNIEISKKLNIPQTTISHKIKNIQKSGIIAKYSIFLNPKKIGYQSFKILISLREFSLDASKKILAYAKQKKTIYYYVKCIGKWNIELESDAKDLQDFQQTLIDIRNHFSDIIQDIEFIAIFDEHKYTYFTEEML
ncbi:winged helix-turn-helix transcriptional regulator [Candidatus Woesearchaeota archaeon]|nr:winged helix-turn-helix transcriptional regulator [Candidatus Woesearchaeota archaeon]